MRHRARAARGTLALAGLLLIAPPLAGQEPGLAHALRSLGSDFAIEDGSQRVTADLNGDGGDDVAAIVRQGDRNALVVFHASPRGYEAVPLYTRLPSGPVELSLAAPGRHAVLGPERVVEIRGPALRLVFPGRSSALYVWRGGRYQVYATESY